MELPLDLPLGLEWEIKWTGELPGPKDALIVVPGGSGAIPTELRQSVAQQLGVDLSDPFVEGVVWSSAEQRLLILPAPDKPEDFPGILSRGLISETPVGQNVYIAMGALEDMGVPAEQEAKYIIQVVEEVYEGNFAPAQITIGNSFGLDLRDLFESIVSDEETPASAKRRATGTPFNDDHPISSINGDLLNRHAIAEAVAENVRHAWAYPPPRPFILHLAGRWGTGKSTVLNFVAELLSKPVLEPLDERPNRDPSRLINRDAWVIVKFNAWQQQNEGNAWWSLLNALAKQAPEQLSWPRKQAFKVWDWWWRITGQFLTLLAGFVLAVLAMLYFWISTPEPDPDALPVGATETITETRQGPLPPAEGLPPGTRTQTRTDVREGRPPETLLDQVGGLKETATLLLALFTALGTLLVRNRKTEAALTELELDPTEPLRTRYAEMVARVDRPVAVLIDDLDRCDASYVVELLQAAQNIYGDVPVLYIVASDRDWLVSSYEQTYAPFSEHVSRPGKPLGYLFVEKIFQLSVTVPDLSNMDREAYLGRLTGPGGAEPFKGIKEFPELAKIRDQLDAVSGDIEGIRNITRVNKDNPEAAAIRAEAFRKSIGAPAEASIRHYLEDFQDKMEANPRAIKRVVNAFQFLQGYALLAGKDVRMEALALWAILDLRFPYATRRLRQDPLRWSQKDVETYAPTPLARSILADLTDEEIETLRRFG